MSGALPDYPELTLIPTIQTTELDEHRNFLKITATRCVTEADEEIAIGDALESRLSKAEMSSVIDSGGAVVVGNRVVTSKKDLPPVEDLVEELFVHRCIMEKSEHSELWVPSDLDPDPDLEEYPDNWWVHKARLSSGSAMNNGNVTKYTGYSNTGYYSTSCSPYWKYILTQFPGFYFKMQGEPFSFMFDIVHTYGFFWYCNDGRHWTQAFVKVAGHAPNYVEISECHCWCGWWNPNEGGPLPEPFIE